MLKLFNYLTDLKSKAFLAKSSDTHINFFVIRIRINFPHQLHLLPLLTDSSAKRLLLLAPIRRILPRERVKSNHQRWSWLPVMNPKQKLFVSHLPGNCVWPFIISYFFVLLFLLLPIIYAFTLPHWFWSWVLNVIMYLNFIVIFSSIIVKDAFI